MSSKDNARMEISYGTVGFRDYSLEHAFEKIAEVGFTLVELSSMEPHLDNIPKGASLERVKKSMRECGLRAGTVHAPLAENVLGAPEESWRIEKVGVCSDYLRLSGELGAGGMVIHPVPNPMLLENVEHIGQEQAIVDAVRRSLDDLVPVAIESGVRMLLENLPYENDGHYPLLSMTELRPLIEPYPQEAVGLVVDTGHAWTSGHNPVSEIKAAGERLWGTHLQDVDGENPQDNHWAPTQGNLNWHAIRQALLDVNYRGNWTFEVIRPRDGHNESPDELAHITFEAASKLELHP